eukprot:jgi/Psemu1/13607/gm1.13607_g
MTIVGEKHIIPSANAATAATAAAEDNTIPRANAAAAATAAAEDNTIPPTNAAAAATTAAENNTFPPANEATATTTAAEDNTIPPANEAAAAATAKTTTTPSWGNEALNGSSQPQNIPPRGDTNVGSGTLSLELFEDDSQYKVHTDEMKRGVKACLEKQGPNGFSDNILTDKLISAVSRDIESVFSQLMNKVFTITKLTPSRLAMLSDVPNFQYSKHVGFYTEFLYPLLSVSTNTGPPLYLLRPAPSVLAISLFDCCLLWVLRRCRRSSLLVTTPNPRLCTSSDYDSVVPAALLLDRFPPACLLASHCSITSFDGRRPPTPSCCPTLLCSASNRVSRPTDDLSIQSPPSNNPHANRLRSLGFTNRLQLQSALRLSHHSLPATAIHQFPSCLTPLLLLSLKRLQSTPSLSSSSARSSASGSRYPKRAHLKKSSTPTPAPTQAPPSPVSLCPRKAASLSACSSSSASQSSVTSMSVSSSDSSVASSTQSAKNACSSSGF